MCPSAAGAEQDPVPEGVKAGLCRVNLCMKGLMSDTGSASKGNSHRNALLHLGTAGAGMCPCPLQGWVWGCWWSTHTSVTAAGP